MTLREISSASCFAGDFLSFTAMPSIELMLHCFGMFRALEYDYESGRGYSDIGSVTWHLDSIEPKAISAARTLAASIVEKEPCKYTLEELVRRVSAKSRVVNRQRKWDTLKT